MQTVTIATWNVNSVRSRIGHLRDWLARDKIDIILLQELKCMDDAFPAMEIEELGYNLALHGEKTYNGVAILSKFPLEDVSRGLPGDETDTQSRYIEALATTPAGVLRVASVYVPNGSEVGSDKFAYKLGFLARLRAHARALLAHQEKLIIGGDYNIAPFDADVNDVPRWADSVLCHPDVRAPLRSMLNDGFYDAWKLKNHTDITHKTRELGGAISPRSSAPCDLPSANHGGNYSWYDYRAGAFEKNDGLRIDHLLLSPQAADSLKNCHIEMSLRALEKPSDHAPVVCTLA